MVDVDGRNSPRARSTALVAGGTPGRTAAAYKVTAADDMASLARAEPCITTHAAAGGCCF